MKSLKVLITNFSLRERTGTELYALRVDPCIPPSWPGFEVRRNWRGLSLLVRVSNTKGFRRGVRRVRIGERVLEGNAVPLSSLFDGAVIDVDLEG